MQEVKRLVRPKEGRVIGGVALGLARYFNIDVVLVRAVFLLLLLPGGLPGLLPYIILWIVMPSEE
ncbi:MAG: PspC domain-containing protein [Patescibacteria group bacterium]|jgi:phage shock protein C